TDSITRRNLSSRSGERFRHDDVVARHFCVQGWSERGSADFNVPQTPVKRWERRALTDDAQIDRAATSNAEIILCGGNQLAAQTSALARRIHGEQAQIASAMTDFQVNTPGESGGVFHK